MANIVFNIAKGRVVEYYNRVKSNDPATSGLKLVPIETTGLEADATLVDKDTVADLIAGTTNRQTTMADKSLTDSDLAALPAPDDANDRYDISLPTVTWAAATGNPISKICVAYFPDVAGADTTGVPLTLFDAVVTPDGSDIQLTGGTFFRGT